MGDVIHGDFGGPSEPEEPDRPSEPPDPRRPDYFALFAARAAAYEPTLEEKQAEVRAKLRDLRKGRLERAKPSLRPHLFDAIVEGLLEETSALGWVRRWRNYQLRRAVPAKNYMVLLGLTGRGKTAAAGWLLAEEGGYYVTADELRRKVVSPSWKDRDWLDHFCQGHCVVIDDLGTEVDAAGANAALFEVVNRRLPMRRAFTVLTGNLNEEEFRARYDSRTIRRLEDAGTIIVVDGADLRGGGKP